MPKAETKQKNVKQPDIEEALRKSEERFRRMFEQSSLGMALSDRTFHFTAANAAFCGILGYTEAEILQLTFKDITHPDHLTRDTEAIQSLAKGKIESYKTEKRYLTKSGAIITGAVTVTALHDDSGKHVQSLVMLENISERKRAEEALRESEDKFKHFFESSKIAKSFTLPTGEISVNQAFCDLLGYSREELSNKKWQELTPPEEVGPIEKKLKSLLSGEQDCVRFFKRYFHKNGSFIWADVTVGIRRDSLGKPLYFMTTIMDITEQKRSEEALRESEERFSKAFKISPYAYIIAALDDGRIVEVNNAFMEISGFTREEALASSTLKLNLWENEQDRQLMVTTLREGKALVRRENTLRRKNGDLRTVLLSAQVVQLSRKPYILSIAEDITERKQAEKALVESECRFSKIIDQAPIAMAIVSLTGDIEFINQKSIKVFGFLPQDIPTMDRLWVQAYPDEVYRKKAKADWTERIQRALTEGGEIAGNEYRVTCKDGAVKTVFISGVPIQDKIFVLFDDITESKHAEEALRESEENFRVLFNESPLATVLSEIPSGKIAFVNKRMADALGMSATQIIGKSANDLGILKNSADQEQLTAMITKQGFVDNVEVENVLSDGSPGNDLVFMRLVTINGKIYCLTVIQDITERKKTEALLMNAQKLESLGVLAGGIAHDFNNLLTGIFGYIDLALFRSKDAVIVEYLGKTMSTLNRARALTLQLLTFAKGGAPVQKIVPLMPFLQETVQFALSGSNISSQFNVTDDLWPCNIDKNQIGQVIDNIVINAQQAMPGGGVIQLSAKNILLREKEHPLLTKGNYVKISIQDFGIGMPKEIISYIFDPFYTTKSKGHGLGLAVSYSIISRHGGCIDVDSEPGTGSTFHVYLPASAGPTVTDATSVVRHKGSGTIVVLDDEEVVRDTLRTMLESLGYKVICENDGKDAIDAYVEETQAKQDIVAMVFDLTIPGGMGGKEAVAEIRKLNKVIPVFVASGYAENSVMKNPGEYGFTASISKPFTIAELSEMLNRHLTPSQSS
jgi:PAS domain S-box-containing protein